jgi:TRAF3-interacting protein 1
MTEKLLSRPPFRYIHDIITATIEATGWGHGIFVGEEQVSKSIAEKEQKIFVLQKVIDLVQLATGQEIAARPIKIVAGQECEETNLFLQAFYQAATSGSDSGPLVAQVLANHGQGEGPAEEEEPENDGADEEAAARAEAEQAEREAAEAAAQAEEEERRRRKKEKKRKMMEEK